MNYEDELLKAYEDFKSTVSGTSAKGYAKMLGLHINEMERYADNCKFSEVAQHMRELGQEAKSLDDMITDLKKAEIITAKKANEISDKLATLWTKIDKFIAAELVENCNCKMRSINY